MISHLTRTYTDSILEQNVEENVRTQEGGNTRRLENPA
jgi:hypothetical protein